MFIQLNALQSVPASSPNRDKSGGQKSILFGGSNRVRYSSQSQKRAARQWYRDYSGVDRDVMNAERSRLWHNKLAALIADNFDYPETVARFLLGILNTGTEKIAKQVLEENSNLLFLGAHEIEAMSNIARTHHKILDEIASDIEAQRDEKKPSIKVNKTAVNGIKKDIEKISNNVVGDVALFGRMMAQSSDLSVDGCVQVAHAISANAFQKSRTREGTFLGEVDFFSAVDDLVKITDDESGAGMIGERCISSPVMYRYANIAVNECTKLIGDSQKSRDVVSAFINGFIRSLPQAGKTSYAHNTLPEFILIELTEYQPYMHASAFLNAIDDRVGDLSILQQSASTLMKRVNEMHKVYGDEPTGSFIVSLSDVYPGGMSLNDALNKTLDLAFAQGV